MDDLHIAAACLEERLVFLVHAKRHAQVLYLQQVVAVLVVGVLAVGVMVMRLMVGMGRGLKSGDRRLPVGLAVALLGLGRFHGDDRHRGGALGGRAVAIFCGIHPQPPILVRCGGRGACAG